MKVLVTCPPMLKQIEKFSDRFSELGWEVTAAKVTQVLSEDELCEIVPEHDGWIIGDDPATKRVVQAGVAGDLKAAVKWGVGVDNVDFEAFKACNTPVINTPGMFGNEVADVALGYVIGLARHTFEIHQGVVAGQWPKPSGVSLAGKTVALVGFGDIGQATAKRFAACGMHVNVYDPFVNKDLINQMECKQFNWPEALNLADFLVFTCALTDSTRHMFNIDTLPQCKPGLRVVNVARGPLINEKALIIGLDRDIIKSCALDVFENEPLSVDNPLRNYPQNIFGSHNGSNTIDAVVKTSYHAIDLLNDFLS